MWRLFFLVTFLSPTLALAFRLDPVVSRLEITEPRASTSFTVENNTKGKIAVQFELRGRVVDVNGKEERPAVEGFLIYPEQMALEAGEKRNVRVSWVGANMPAKEMAYRFIASQLPVDFSDAAKAGKAANLKFLIEYVASLYLVPPKAYPKMRMLSHKVKKNTLEVLVANEGNAHQLLERMEIFLSAGKEKVQLQPKALQEARTENVLAGSERKLLLPLPAGWAGKKFSVDIAFSP